MLIAMLFKRKWNVTAHKLTATKSVTIACRETHWTQIRKALRSSPFSIKEKIFEPLFQSANCRIFSNPINIIAYLGLPQHEVCGSFHAFESILQSRFLLSNDVAGVAKVVFAEVRKEGVAQRAALIPSRVRESQGGVGSGCIDRFAQYRRFGPAANLCCSTETPGGSFANSTLTAMP